MNRKHKPVLIVAAIIITVLVLTTVLSPRKSSKVEPLTHIVAVHDISKSVHGSGKLLCSVRAEINSEISGKLVEITANEGDLVKAGDVLALIDNENIQNEVSIARGEVAEHQDELEKLKNRPDASEKLAAEIKHEEAQKNQEKLARDLKEKQQLYEKGLGGTPRGIEDLKKSLISAEKTLKIAERNLEEASKEPTEVQIAAAASRLNQAEIKLNNLQHKLDAQKVASPVAGTVLKRFIDPETIKYQPDKIYSESTSLFIVGDLATLTVEGTVFESDIRKIVKDQKVRVILNPVDSKFVWGRLERVSLTPRGTSDSAKFDVDISFDTPPQNINEGLRVDFQIIVAEVKNTVAVPVEFVHRENDEFFVMLQSGGQLKKHSIEPGIWDNNYYQIKSGLTPGDKIVWTLDN
ncbi:Multidrug resistance protein MdtA [subsurface metagenome]